MTGGEGAAAIRSASSMPSIPGICTSSSARSNGPPPSMSARASAPEATATGSIPQRRARRMRISRLTSLSSTMSVRRPVRCGGLSVWNTRRTPGATSAWSVNVNTLPTPTSLVAESAPSIISARRREIASPSPVPPYSRVVEASAWVNAPKTCASFSGGMPTPVSSMLNRSAHRCGGGASGGSPETRTQTLPSCVNFTALERRLTSTCRTRVTSPTMAIGAPSSITYASSIPFCAAGCATRSNASSTHRRTSIGASSTSSIPASIFEKSRMSLMMVSKASPEDRIVSTNPDCSASSGVSASRLVIPITPFMGVRISWLMLARNSLFAFVAASAASFASISAASARFSSVTSRVRPTSPIVPPLPSRSGSLVVERHPRL